VVEGGGAGRTGKLSDGHVVSGGTGDIIVGHHWGADWLQCPVGGVLPVHARGEGGDRVNGGDISMTRSTWETGTKQCNFMLNQIVS